MSVSRPALRVDLEQLRRGCILAQGLGAAGKGSLAELLERTGFVRTLGGADVYLALRARFPGLSRASLEAQVEAGELKVLPAARGCIYLVPRREAGLALSLAALLSRARDERDRERAGIKQGELEQVGEAVLRTLERGPLTTDALRRDLPQGTLRSLGEAGKKVGVSSPLPPALRRLEFSGRVERIPQGGRLDTERYLWRLARSGRKSSVPELSGDLAGLLVRLGELYFRAAFAASTRDFSGWAGVSLREAGSAVEKLGLIPVEAEGMREGLWMPEEHRDLLGRLDEADAAVAFLPFEDNLFALHGGIAFLVPAEHHDLQVPVWGMGKKTQRLGDAAHMSLRSLIVRGGVAGFWEYDPDRQEVILGTFHAPDRATAGALETERAALSRFLRDELGHGRSFSLDTDEELRRRAALVRGLGPARRPPRAPARRRGR